MRIKTILGSIFLIVNFLSAQNTIGLLSYNPTKAYDGYNLIYPHGQPNVYLLDNCGEIVHLWEDERGFLPGNAAYILENGNLVKTKRRNTPPTTDPIWAGGGGETIELRSWENELLASYTLNDSLFRLHHDIAALPNGNILMIAWANKTAIEAQQAGRDTSLLTQQKVWSEVILEWNPTKNEIVWEWHAWDHLIQDVNSNRDNFGDISSHPELIDINYDEHNGHPDWLHINAIDYNPVLDQIILSVPYFNECWIIDHSTTISEAASHQGGKSKRGGDLLYRWGNPMAYQSGDTNDKRLFFQHHTHWVAPNAEPGEEHFGQIALFNNRVGEQLSTGNTIQTNYNQTTNAYEMMNGIFLPFEFRQTIRHPNAEEEPRAASSSVSSAQFLANGNVVLCAGRSGYAYEISPSNQIVWEYVVPIRAGGPTNQGEVLTTNQNLTFRLTRYGVDFPAFIDKDVTPKGYLEINPNEDFCGALSVASPEIYQTDLSIKVYPNPASQFLLIDKGNNKAEKWCLIDALGKKILQGKFYSEKINLPVAQLNRGIYFLAIEHTTVQKIIIEF